MGVKRGFTVVKNLHDSLNNTYLDFLLEVGELEELPSPSDGFSFEEEPVAVAAVTLPNGHLRLIFEGEVSTAWCVCWGSWEGVWALSSASGVRLAD